MQSGQLDVCLVSLLPGEPKKRDFPSTVLYTNPMGTLNLRNPGQYGSLPDPSAPRHCALRLDAEEPLRLAQSCDSWGTPRVLMVAPDLFTRTLPISGSSFEGDDPFLYIFLGVELKTCHSCVWRRQFGYTF